MRSLISSLLGAGPEGTVTFGSDERGPLVGVLAAGVDSAGLDFAADGSVALIKELSALFSAPSVIVLEPLLEPHPAIRAAAPSAARPAPKRERRVGFKELKLVTVGQPIGTWGVWCKVALRYHRRRTVLGGEGAEPRIRN